jgi:hypothetical protein
LVSGTPFNPAVNGLAAKFGTIAPIVLAAPRHNEAYAVFVRTGRARR